MDLLLRFQRFAVLFVCCFVILSESALAQTPEKLVLVVPVYRELDNQNIGRLISSIAQQNSTDPPMEIEVVWVVNNTQDVDGAIRMENKATVKFLQDLSAGKAPTLKDDQYFLKQAAADFSKSKIKFHVLDHTSPGFKERNIGLARDLGNQYALSLIPQKNLDNTLISQMDADTRIPKNYAERLQGQFQNQRTAFGFVGYKFGYEADPEPVVFASIIKTQIESAIANLGLTVSGDLPWSGPPRTIARASAIEAVGGVPHTDIKEGAALVTNLKKEFPGRGVYLSDIAVMPNYRLREDGYDSLHYRERLQDPFFLFFDSSYPTAQAMLDHEEDTIHGDSKKLTEYNKRYETLRKEKETEISERRTAFLRIIEYLQLHNKMPSMKNEADPLFHTPWLEGYLRNRIRGAPSSDAAMTKISKDMQHLLRLPLSSENDLITRMDAMAATLNPSSKAFVDPALTKRATNPHHSGGHTCGDELRE